MMKYAFLVLFIGLTSVLHAQDTGTERTEYLTVRVQYGKTISGYQYEVYLDIGVSGAHSMSGKVTNNEKTVTIIDDYGRHEFKSDIDLLNYLGIQGWKVIHSGEINILDQHYYTYLLERKYVKKN